MWWPHPIIGRFETLRRTTGTDIQQQSSEISEVAVTLSPVVCRIVNSLRKLHKQMWHRSSADQQAKTNVQLCVGQKIVRQSTNMNNAGQTMDHTYDFVRTQKSTAPCDSFLLAVPQDLGMQIFGLNGQMQEKVSRCPNTSVCGQALYLMEEYFSCSSGEQRICSPTPRRTTEWNGR
uniref:Uncharacterized protein n=1 Tax=Entomoneis paludosa TaxID=265537 RepID=A0A6U2WYT8_9STRA|mmetsp:Transcript_11266/g.23050  ORF Transcript_11266/g.23050 Transcript_11266/m.23050 type:complete len:176 (+) Transcript_11266:793-1320(+)